MVTNPVATAPSTWATMPAQGVRAEPTVFFFSFFFFFSRPCHLSPFAADCASDHEAASPSLWSLGHVGRGARRGAESNIIDGVGREPGGLIPRSFGRVAEGRSAWPNWILSPCCNTW